MAAVSQRKALSSIGGTFAASIRPTTALPAHIMGGTVRRKASFGVKRMVSSAMNQPMAWRLGCRAIIDAPRMRGLMNPTPVDVTDCRINDDDAT